MIEKIMKELSTHIPSVISTAAQAPSSLHREKQNFLKEKIDYTTYTFLTHTHIFWDISILCFIYQSVK